MKYRIKYVYEHNDTICVEANSEREAREIVERMWDDKELKITIGELDPLEFTICDARLEEDNE